MAFGGETKRNLWITLSVPLWDTINPWSTIRRLRSELSRTEELLAEANRERDDFRRKLSAGGRTAAQNHRIKVMAKAAEIRG